MTLLAAGGLDVEALYRRERDRIHAMCLAILRDQGDAEDAVQETFARIAAHAATLQGDPTGYVVVVARNVCRDELRRRARRAQPGVAPRGDPTPEETAVQRGLLGFVWRHLARVEQTLLTYVYSGMSMAEIGERTGTSGDVAAQRVSRLRRRIRNLVAAPAALLVPVLRGSAAGRALAARLHLGSLLSPAIDRLQSVEQAMAPLLVSIAAGAMGMPHNAIPAQAAAHPVVAAHSTPAPHRPSGVLPSPAQVLEKARNAVHAAASPVAAAASKLHVPAPPPDGLFQSFTPSPQFLRDHVVFATTAEYECAHAPCATVWRSSDGGATWKPVSTQQIAQFFSIALPPSWPADPTVFALDSSEIYRSDDGGATYRRVVVTAGFNHVAVDPTSRPGDTRIIFDANTGTPLEYTATDGGVHPLPGLPAGTTASVVPIGDQVYLDASGPATPEALYSCPATASTCTPAGKSSTGYPNVASPQFDADHTYFAVGYQSVLVGTLEGGPAGRTLAVPWMVVDQILPAADYDRSGVLDLVVQPAQSSSPATSGLRLANGVVQPWGLQLPAGASAMTRLPDGDLLAAAPMAMGGTGAYSGGGVLCSRDDGLSWSLGC